MNYSIDALEVEPSPFSPHRHDRISKMHPLSSSSSYHLIHHAFPRLQGCFRKVGTLAYLTRPLRRVPVPRTGKICCYSVNTVQHDYPQPLTVDDYHVLIEAERLDGQPIELLNGFLTRKLPQSPAHRFTTTSLYMTFFGALARRAVIIQAGPITLAKSNSEPEPDIVIVSGVHADYGNRHPAPDDILLTVEVSNATLHKDSSVKLELYASENIQEYWIVDVMSRSVRVLRNPEGKRYLHDETFCAGDIAPATFPNVVVSVEKLFPDHHC